MRTYEALYIIESSLEDDEVQTMASEVEKLITDSGGAIVRSEIWGKRRLAYMVNKHREGYYVLVRFQVEPEFIDKLKAFFRLSERIIRNLVSHFDSRSLRLEEEQTERTQALIEARNAHGSRPGGDDDDDEVIPRRSRPAEAPEEAPAKIVIPAEPVPDKIETPAEPKPASEPVLDS